ncbi:MAG TPA: helix-turn-helix domain-containing protein [Candidatus Paceibacterota bacterium]
MPLAIKKALEKLGLREKEARVLLALLESGGPTFVASIARAAKLQRTTTYGILKDLSAAGLVTSAKKAGATQYQSIAPELLPAYIERRGQELLDTKEEVAKLVPQIKLLRSKAHVLPKVQFFEGTEGIEQAFEDKLENNADKALYEFTGMDAGYEKMNHKFIDYYLNKRARLKIFSKYISPDTPFAQQKALDDEKHFRKVKFIPAKYKMDTEISIYDNKVSLASFSSENPVAILIEDENLARTMKQIFDYIESTANIV